MNYSFNEARPALEVFTPAIQCVHMIFGRTPREP